MKNKFYLLMLTAFAALFFSSCHNSGKNDKPLGTTYSGSPLIDSVNYRKIFTLQHNTTNGYNYLGYYVANTVVVDTNVTPHTISIQAQAARFDSVNEAWVLHATSISSLMYSNISVNTDTIAAVYAGPFDPVGGQFYTYKGYLYYTSKYINDSAICPISSIIYWNQSGAGAGVAIGWVAQNDLH